MPEYYERNNRVSRFASRRLSDASRHRNSNRHGEGQTARRENQMYGHQGEAVYTGFSNRPLDVQSRRDDRILARILDDNTESLSPVEKLTEAIEASGDYLTKAVVEELKAVFSPESLATMIGVFGIYVASHATGVGQAADILMLLAGGVFFGLDTISIFKDLAGFGNAINATTEEDIEKAGKHLADLVATISVDLLMTLLTSKVAEKISKGVDRTSGVEEPGTTTGDMDDINHSIRRHNAPVNDRSPYTPETVGNEIVNNSVASKAYQRINDQGYDVRINYDRPPEPDLAGRTQKGTKNIEVYAQNNYNNDEVVSTIVHESTHVEYRHKKRRPYNTQYEEYRAAVREEIYKRSKDPTLPSRPDLKERRRIWQKVLRDYNKLPQGKHPFEGSRND